MEKDATDGYTFEKLRRAGYAYVGSFVGNDGAAVGGGNKIPLCPFGFPC